MRTIACIVSYDGTAYQGWQEQPARPTIAGYLQSSFADVFGQQIKVVGASRTDAGVHAQGQTARFYTDIPVDCTTMITAWNRRLPEDIVITKLGPAAPHFHPHHGVAQKIYRYTIYTQRPLPFAARYGWWYDRPLNVKKLQSCLPYLIGTHDFRSFCTGDDMLNTIRTVDAITLQQQDEAIALEFRGASFLRYMIRRMVGACVTVATKPYLTPEHIQQTLAAKDPRHHLVTAPSCGLTLVSIDYEQPIFAQDL